VILSGICNFLGVFLGGIAVALSVTRLLPSELLAPEQTSLVLALIMALLVAATLWNLGTWYYGIPCSSSHTLIGSLLGAGLGYSLLPGHVFGSGINWGKAAEVMLSLLISPLLGFFLSYLLLKLAKVLLRDRRFHEPPRAHKSPPVWIRSLLIGTCAGVSLAHGSNDGQKGIGLLMIILIGFMPAEFALNQHHNAAVYNQALSAALEMRQSLVQFTPGAGSSATSEAGIELTRLLINSLSMELDKIAGTLATEKSVAQIPGQQRLQLRQHILFADSILGNLEIEKKYFSKTNENNWKELNRDMTTLRQLTDYAPSWVLLLTALALGLGTMFGWKRIVVTVGEKIGKEHLTCAQGASAELVAMSTIGLSSWFGLPVSTTHVLSSGVSGAMVAQPAGLQLPTVKKIASAWILTLPVSMLLSAGLFLLFWLVFC
jgi:PiT family inorganic phosphate transporter